MVANPEGNPDLDEHVYRSLARSYILEQQRLETRKKRLSSVYATVLSTAFFIGVMVIVYLGAR
jgi:hypothetical protein